MLQFQNQAPELDKTSSISKARHVTNIITGCLIVILIIVVSFPLLWMTLSSFKPAAELFKNPPSILPKHWSLDWYFQAFQNNNVIHYFLNSLKIALIVMIVDMMVGSLSAYGLTRFDFYGRKVLLTSILAAYCVPPIMLMLPLYKIMTTLNLSGSHVGVIIGHLTITLPFSIWLMVSFFQKLPKSIDESARIDGANEWQIFLVIDFPLCKSGVLSAGIMAFIMSWNEFLLASVLTNQEDMKTLTVGLANYISSTHIDWGIIMALGTITTIPVLVLFSSIQQYFVEGMTAGSVKE